MTTSCDISPCWHGECRHTQQCANEHSAIQSGSCSVISFAERTSLSRCGSLSCERKCSADGGSDNGNACGAKENDIALHVFPQRGNKTKPPSKQLIFTVVRFSLTSAEEARSVTMPAAVSRYRSL